VNIFEDFTIQRGTSKRKGLKNSKPERSRTGFVLLKDDLCRVEIINGNLFYSSAIKALVLVVLSKVFLEEVGNGLGKHIVATPLWAWLMSLEPVRRVHFVFLR
jgi:hypothetical protein